MTSKRVTLMIGEGTYNWIDRHKSFFGYNSVSGWIKYAIGQEIERQKKLAENNRTQQKKWGYEY